MQKKILENDFIKKGRGFKRNIYIIYIQRYGDKRTRERIETILIFSQKKTPLKNTQTQIIYSNKKIPVSHVLLIQHRQETKSLPLIAF